MWPFKKEKEWKLVSLRHCICGAKDFREIIAKDAVKCKSCGAIYIIINVNNPAAEWIDITDN